jgi:hypothetical protein
MGHLGNSINIQASPQKKTEPYTLMVGFLLCLFSSSFATAKLFDKLRTEIKCFLANAITTFAKKTLYNTRKGVFDI